MNLECKISRHRRLGYCAALLCIAAFAQGCIQDPAAVNSTAGAETSDVPLAPAQTMAGGVAIPSEVRENLGITFARVERRQVQDVLRVPGSFELLPGARQEYRMSLAGHVQVKVSPFQTIRAGEVLFTVDSPEWRRIQHEAVEAEGEITIAQAALRVAQARLEEAKASEALVKTRVKNLAAVAVRKADLEAEAIALRSSLQRLQAEIDAARAASAEAEEHYDSRLRTLSSIASISVEDLRAPASNGLSHWRAIRELEVRAKEDGTVEDLLVNQGAWLETGTLVLTALDPAAVQFHGDAPQSELVKLRDGLACTIVPPEGGGVALQAEMTGALQLGLTAHAQDRTISVFVQPATLLPWARAGVLAYLEVPLADEAPQLAIPVGSLVQDGLDTLFFRRHPSDPNRALPVKADLGPSDGRWVVVQSGVKEGDEVVLDGAYALKLAGGSTKAPEGYHYHADGQLHKNH